ncbi:hypothetical protein LY78DRAFT_685079 [Colletotrichum sublineola]|nr:hypothetical protein LY78DRAFT_685079 [Colletotrichum sublineola]
MARVGYLTHEMSKPDGIIESMLKFIDPDQSRLRDKILHRHIISSVIKKALKDLKDLQEETTRFLDFLTGIQTMIISADDKRNHVFMGDLTPEERRDLICDSELKEKLQEDALFLKNRFLIATKATSLYNDVSEKFVTPGVQWEAGLQLLDLTDNALNTKIKEIEEWRVKNM